MMYKQIKRAGSKGISMEQGRKTRDYLDVGSETSVSMPPGTPLSTGTPRHILE